MGTTKRACELTLTALAKGCTTKFITVRFGNVLGSSGSVVPLFREQIRRGGPVTVTHPDIERYLMLIPEAVYLVLHAASIGKGGELFVLDMGEPIKIADLARNMITLSGFEPGKDIKIEYVGLRPGEKLYDELFSHDEKVFRTSSDKILMAIPKNSTAPAAVLGYVDQLERCILRKDCDGMLKTLCMLVTNYNNATGTMVAEPEGEQIRRAA
jgi:FlaA1/EpsC-like NDP-sugar epimerase